MDEAMHLTERLLSESEIHNFLRSHRDWIYAENALSRKLNFISFEDAVSFIMRCSLEIEKLNHHPEWSNVYSRVSIVLRTHEAGGVTRLDTELASKMDDILRSYQLRQ
ncbi:MAG: 4a-hydroxytetrahydrobiopterin dehydratase [Methanomassiliicoccales archaeon]